MEGKILAWKTIIIGASPRDSLELLLKQSGRGVVWLVAFVLWIPLFVGVPINPLGRILNPFGEVDSLCYKRFDRGLVEHHGRGNYLPVLHNLPGIYLFLRILFVMVYRLILSILTSLTSTAAASPNMAEELCPSYLRTVLSSLIFTSSIVFVTSFE